VTGERPKAAVTSRQAATHHRPASAGRYWVRRHATGAPATDGARATRGSSRQALECGASGLRSPSRRTGRAGQGGLGSPSGSTSCWTSVRSSRTSSWAEDAPTRLRTAGVPL